LVYGEQQLIKRFSVLYVGQIDLDNVGVNGTPPDDRRYTNEQLTQTYSNAMALAKQMDDSGFYCLWTAEHHFQREGYECIPNLTLLGTHLAAHTKNLKFGAAFNILPMWHPLRLAEDFSLGDILTGGRLIFGIGRGYQAREVETFGSPLIDQDANRELFEEQVEIILKAFNQESFSHHGKHYDIPPDVPYRGYQLEEITLVPRPINLPVEIWQPMSSGRSIDFIAKKGIKGMTALSGEKVVEQFFTTYKDSAAEAGRSVTLGQDMSLGFGFYLADTQKEAIEKVRPYHDERYKWFSPFGLVRYVDEEGRMWGSPGAPARTPMVEDGVQQKAWLCGSPEYFIETLKEMEEKYPGLEDVFLQWPEGMPWSEMSDQLEIFSKEVIPAFNGRG
jgi:alkanesulfonate monooxygenase SsuD/methylene tetrahydromethanopterin reductase-like flavin-dependent oxidoreductase (luciferase family)|tara:strand:+ start:143 stop:1309 length:1167 start_codon:yes stop_codon:yes gene_type:complete